MYLLQENPTDQELEKNTLVEEEKAIIDGQEVKEVEENALDEGKDKKEG